MSTRYSGEAFKRGIVRYASGRLLNALSAFAIFVWVARQLPPNEYAIYVAAFALFEVGLAIAGFGMEWVTAVFIPQVRLNASGRELWRFVSQCAGVQAITLAAGSVLLYALAPELSRWLGLPGAQGAFRAYAVVMFVDGVGRVLRDQLLACLLLQGAAQLSQFARNVALLAGVIVMFSDEARRTAEGLAYAEIVASSIGLLVAGALLLRYLLLARHDPAPSSQWRRPAWRELIRVARNAWLANLANLTWSWSVVVLLVTRTIGAEATAALGFARNLAEQIRRYMPMEFLFGIMRTFLIARYDQDRDAKALGVRVGLMYKVNLLFLLPLLIVAIIHGDSVCGLLSSGRYASAHGLLAGWLIVMIALAHRRLTDVLAHTLGRSDLTVKASAILIITPIAVLAAARLDALGVIFGILLIAEVIYSLVVIRGLYSTTWRYAPDWSGLGKLGVAGLGAAAVLLAVPLQPALVAVITAIGLAYAVTWAAVWLLRGWNADEAAILSTGLR